MIIRIINLLNNIFKIIKKIILKKQLNLLNQYMVKNQLKIHHSMSQESNYYINKQKKIKKNRKSKKLINNKIEHKINKLIIKKKLNIVKIYKYKIRKLDLLIILR